METSPLFDSARLAAIRATQLMDSPPEECFDRYTRLAKRLLKAEMAIISLVGKDRQFYKSCLGLPEEMEKARGTPIGFSLCKIGVQRRETLVINDGATDPEFRDHPAINELGVRSYLGVPLFDESGHALGTLCVVNMNPHEWTSEDTTTLEVLAQSVRNEILLRKLEIQQAGARSAENLLGRIMDTSVAAITVLNPEGRIVYCNRAAELVLGLMPSEVEGKSYDDPEWRSTDVDGGPWPDERQPFNVVLSTGQPVHDIQHAIEWPDGSRRIISVSGAPLRDDAGEISQLVFQVTDITEQFESTARLKHVAEQFHQTFRLSANFAVLCDCDENRIIEVSAGFLNSLHLDRDECVGRRLVELPVGVSADLVAELAELGPQVDQVPREVNLKTSDGDERVVLVTAQVLEVAGNHYLRVTGQDITAQRAAERRRTELEQQLQNAQRTEIVGQLASGLAHEFNNILTAMIGNAELTARMIEPDHRAQRSLTVIKRAGQRAVDQVRQMLSVGGQSSDSISRSDVVEVVRECLELFKPQCPAGIRLELVAPPHPVAVPASGSRLHQVFMNLLINAAQAIGDGSGTIKVQVDQQASVSRHKLTSEDPVIVEVCDDGPGIPADDLERIFEAFYSTKASEMGSGIGLTLARTVARGFGGELSVTSEVGQGATFRLQLPRTVVGDSSQASTKDPFGQGAERESLQILLVDDDEEVLTTGCLMIEQLGHEVDTASNGAEALDEIKTNPGKFDLLITDNLMPRLTGIELIQELRDAEETLPAVLVSGYGTARIQIEKLGENTAVFMPKPFTLAEIAQAIEKAMKMADGAPST